MKLLIVCLAVLGLSAASATVLVSRLPQVNDTSSTPGGHLLDDSSGFLYDQNPAERLLAR